MVLKLPLENGGMNGFVDRFNKACNSSASKKEVPKNTNKLDELIKTSATIDKNAPISKYNDKGIMFGLILLYGIPDLSNPERLKSIVPESRIANLKKTYAVTGKAIESLLKILGLG